MGRSMLVLGLASSVFLAIPLAATAATSPAQILKCTTATACYSPDPIRITARSTVTWMNATALAHTATAESGGWDTGAIASGATSAGIAFNTPGTFAYHCRFHADMHGTVIVSAAVSTTPVPTTRATTTPPTKGLAQSGGGPAPVFGGLAVFLGVLLLGSSRLRRKRLQRSR